MGIKETFNTLLSLMPAGENIGKRSMTIHNGDLIYTGDKVVAKIPGFMPGIEGSFRLPFEVMKKLLAPKYKAISFTYDVEKYSITAIMQLPTGSATHTTGVVPVHSVSELSFPSDENLEDMPSDLNGVSSIFSSMTENGSISYITLKDDPPRNLLTLADVRMAVIVKADNNLGIDISKYASTISTLVAMKAKISIDGLNMFAKVDQGGVPIYIGAKLSTPVFVDRIMPLTRYALGINVSDDNNQLCVISVNATRLPFIATMKDLDWKKRITWNVTGETITLSYEDSDGSKADDVIPCTSNVPIRFISRLIDKSIVECIKSYSTTKSDEIKIVLDMNEKSMIITSKDDDPKIRILMHVMPVTIR